MKAIKLSRAAHAAVGSTRPRSKGQQQQQPVARPTQQAYSTVPARPSRREQLRTIHSTEDDPVLQPLQQVLDDPQFWPQQQSLPSGTASALHAYRVPADPHKHFSRFPAAIPASSSSWLPGTPLTGPTTTPFTAIASWQHPQHIQSAKQVVVAPARFVHASRAPYRQVHRHPPIAPEDPAELLQVLQVMDTPRRRVVIFKGGGYIYADMDAMIQAAGLGHVMRLTNLMRKAHCIVAKEKRDTGKRVNLAEHRAAARNANIPFLLIDRLEPEHLVALLRPLLIKKRIVIEHPQRRVHCAVGQGGLDPAPSPEE